MTTYIYSNELYHVGRSKADGAPGPGTGNYPRHGSLHRYRDMTLTKAGVKKYRRLNKKYQKAWKKTQSANANKTLEEYRAFTAKPNNVKYDFDSKTGAYVEVPYYEPDRPKYIAKIKQKPAEQKDDKKEEKKDEKKTVKVFVNDDKFTYNMHYYRALENYALSKKESDKLEKKIKKLTGMSPEDAEIVYGKKATVGPYYARNLLKSLSRQYSSYYIPTDKSKINAYRSGVKDLEKLFPNSVVTINEEYMDFLRKLKAEGD